MNLELRNSGTEFRNDSGLQNDAVSLLINILQSSPSMN
jgi:hypothetical protein